MTPERDATVAYQLNRRRIWRISHHVRGSSMSPNEASTVPWRGAIVRAYMGWHWLNRYGNCLPCVCLWGEDQQVHPSAIKPIAVTVLFIQELQRNGIITGFICDLDRDLRALRYRTGERDVQSRSHYRVLLVKDKLHGVSSASLSAIAYSPFSGKNLQTPSRHRPRRTVSSDLPNRI